MLDDSIDEFKILFDWLLNKCIYVLSLDEKYASCDYVVKKYLNFSRSDQINLAVDSKKINNIFNCNIINYNIIRHMSGMTGLALF